MKWIERALVHMERIAEMSKVYRMTDDFVMYHSTTLKLSTWRDCLWQSCTNELKAETGKSSKR
jgi:hypothetical protein